MILTELAQYLAASPSCLRKAVRVASPRKLAGLSHGEDKYIIVIIIISAVFWFWLFDLGSWRLFELPQTVHEVQ